MIAFCLRRLVWLAITLWAVFTVTFLLMRAVPGGPFDRERVVPPEIKKNMERRYNLDKPPLEQYWTELSRVSRGDLGYCMNMGDYSVNDVVAQGLPISMALGVLALSFAMSFGLLTGVVAAAMRGSPLDVGLRFAATAGIAVLYLVSFALSFFGKSIPYIHQGGPIGIGFSVFVVIIAALNLVLDFDFIEKGAEMGAPKYMEWYAAFGLLVTLVWLYIEILRLLAKIRSR